MGGIMNNYIIALDAGTTSVRAFLFDTKAGEFVHRSQQELALSCPFPGWVEQDADEIFFKAAYVLSDCIRAASGGRIAGMGIANQRETVVLWDAESGEPVAPAIVWQCRRTSDFCASIPPDMAETIKRKTGLLPDAYFSASKIRWLIERVPAAQKLLKEHRLRAGTVDTFLIWKLTGGRVFATDVTNASRTMLFNISALKWDEELLAYFGIPLEILPEVRLSDERMGEAVLGEKHIPVAAVMGDQQSALFGQGCLTAGDAKITYGTGLFMLFPTGEKPVFSEGGLLTTVGYGYGGKVSYALEGSIFHAGSCVQWLRDEMGLIANAAETERLALSVEDTGGVFFVPAFTGLGAPYWDPDARAMLEGISRGTRREHIVRAVLESIAYGARDLADAMQEGSGVRLRSVKCDGGASANNFLMQFQADVLGIPVDRPLERESTALGVAILSALSLGIYGKETLTAFRRSERLFMPSADRDRYEKLVGGYRSAVKRARFRP